MESIQTWRELLGKLIADPQERQRLAEILNVNPITLTRWATSRSNPHLDNLRALIEALPQHRQQLVESIAQEFPNLLIEAKDKQLQAIPSAFYARVLNANTTSPHRLRTSTMRTLILQQIMAQLDPQQLGLVVTIVQFVLPRPGYKIRSLRVTMSRATSSWAAQVENRTFLLGAESQAGQALITAQPIVVNNQQIRHELYAAHTFLAESSVVVYPILQSEQTAGCLCLASTQAQYFTQERLELIQAYVHLLALAFEPEEFFDLQEIELGVLPPIDIQQGHLTRFQQRVTQILIHAGQCDQTLSRSQAEILAWQEIEEELLRAAEQLSAPSPDS